MTSLLCALRKSRNVMFNTPRCMSPKRVLQHIYMDTFKGGHRRGKRFPRWLSDKESTSQAGSVGLIPGSGRSPGEENGNSLQYSCLGIPWTEEPDGCRPWGDKELDTTEHLNKRRRRDRWKKGQELRWTDMCISVLGMLEQSTTN